MKEYFNKTERIGFSTWSIEDIELAKELWGDPDVTKFISLNGIMSSEQILERLNKEISIFEKSKVQYWPIFLLDTDEFIGCCGLRPYDIDNGIYEFGVHLCKSSWGKGLAYEASIGVLQYAQDELKIIKFFAGHNPSNLASKGLLQKVGFMYTHDEFYEPTGLFHPSYKLEI